MSSEAASSAHHRSVTSHPASKDDKADALVPSLESEHPYAKSTEIRNVILLGVIFSLYFALRSGCVVVLPLACKHLLQDELADATHSPLYQLPLALWFLSDVGLATPNAVFMRRYGRRAGFSLGACVGLVAAVGAFLAMRFVANPWASFILLNVCASIMGVLGMAEFVRYAVMEALIDKTRFAAVAPIVLSFAALTSFFGPFSTSFASYLEKANTLYGYADFCLFAAGFAVLYLVAALGLRLPLPSVSSTTSPTPLSQVLKRPGVWSSILSQVVVQFTMVTPMSGVSLAMDDKFPSAAAKGSFLISGCVVSHIWGMFVPGFFTGKLIGRFGDFSIMAAGLLVQVAANIILLCGDMQWNFYSGLILIGVGWNFSFNAGTSLLMKHHSSEERQKVSSVNESLRFLANAIASILSSTLPWDIINYLGLGLCIMVFPVLVIAHKSNVVQ